MKKALNTSKISSGFNDQIRSLQDLADEISRLESRIEKMTSTLDKIDRDLASGINAESHCPSNVIPFPGLDVHVFCNSEAMRYLASPGKPLPGDIPDFRPLLQRDGLILLAWDKRATEIGERFTAYWVTSMGTPRFYASRAFHLSDFHSARPNHKSYAAEDGIEYYGQEAPAYLVHVAPELMMSNPRHRELRLAHIRTLQDLGSMVDFNYTYLLTKEKKLDLPPGKSKGRNRHIPAFSG